MTSSNFALQPDDGATDQLQTNQSLQPTPIRESEAVDLLLIHGTPAVQGELTAWLAAAGHEVSTSTSIDGALRLLQDAPFEVLVLSLGVAEAASADLVARLRAASDAPLIVLGRDASPSVQDAVFDSGADDYLAELVDPAELDRLVRARARRAASRQRGNELKGPSDITMQVRAHEVFVGSGRLALTPKEFEILRLLLEHRGEVVETEQIALKVWGHETYGSRNFVEAHISRLRQKLNRVDAGSTISTIRGIGYVVR